MKLTPNARRRTVIAGLLASGLVLTTGAGPAPSLLAAASPSDDPASTTATTGTTATAVANARAGTGSRTVDAAGAGTVTFTQSGGRLSLVSAVPSTGWTVEVEQAGGVEIEVDFRKGTRRVQVNLEIEDGGVRERVRIRDEADGTEIRLENGDVVRFDDGDDDRDDERLDGDAVDDDRRDADNSGPGSGDDTDNSGPGSGDLDDDHSGDNSGPGGGDDD
ncbi:MAG TPA: hypothetical protein VJM75_00085 [Acidimicrobiales bacterium]|nr:hypothetical protein [Acidimicrobiales bacterium]